MGTVCNSSSSSAQDRALPVLPCLRPHPPRHMQFACTTLCASMLLLCPDAPLRACASTSPVRISVGSASRRRRAPVSLHVLIRPLRARPRSIEGVSCKVRFRGLCACDVGQIWVAYGLCPRPNRSGSPRDEVLKRSPVVESCESKLKRTSPPATRMRCAAFCLGCYVLATLHKGRAKAAEPRFREHGYLHKSVCIHKNGKRARKRRPCAVRNSEAGPLPCVSLESFQT